MIYNQTLPIGIKSNNILSNLNQYQNSLMWAHIHALSHTHTLRCRPDGFRTRCVPRYDDVGSHERLSRSPAMQQRNSGLFRSPGALSVVTRSPALPEEPRVFWSPGALSGSPLLWWLWSGRLVTRANNHASAWSERAEWNPLRISPIIVK